MEDEKRIAELFEQLGFGEPKRIERLGGLTNRSYRVLSDARDMAAPSWRRHRRSGEQG